MLRVRGLPIEGSPVIIATRREKDSFGGMSTHAKIISHAAIFWYIHFLVFLPITHK